MMKYAGFEWHGSIQPGPPCMSRSISRSSRLSGRRAHLALVMTCALGLQALLVPSPAQAGTYKMYSCNVPGHAVPLPSIAPWRANLDGLNTRLFNGCLVGGGFGIALEPTQRAMHPGSTAGLVLERPAVGPKAAIGIVGYRTWLTAELAGSGAPAFISDGGAFAPPGGRTPDDAPWMSAPLGPSNNVIYVQLYCSTGATSDCIFDSATPLTARGIEVDLYESVLPSGTFDGGTLLSGDLQRGRRSVLFTASDDESGVARIELLLDSAVVASESLETDATTCPHTDLSACMNRSSGSLKVDTSELADGEYTAALRITDAAGNRRLIRYPDSIVIAKSSGSSTSTTSPSSADGQSERLSAQFAANSRSAYTASFGQSVRIRGRLSDSRGRPVANARIVSTEKFDSSSRTLVRETKTGSTGRYSFRVSGRGPSRRIEINYPSGSQSPSEKTSQALRLRVRAASTFHVSLRGIRVSYSGRVLGAPIPRGGKQVFIQGRARGGAWQRFAARWSDASGRFFGTYRLRVRRPGVRLQFRAELPRQTGYPYTPHIGKPVTKTVH